MELYLIRHGETESNLEKRYQGWTESPLSKKGIRQAEKVGFFLAGQNIEGLCCSDLKRAVNTARVIGAGSGLKPVATPLLREINFGQWEGLTFDQIKATWGEEVSLWLDDPYHRAPPGGETLAEVCTRMQIFLEQYTNNSTNKQRIVAVSHGGTIRALLYQILDLNPKSYWDIKIDNASVSLIRKEEGRFKIIYYNRVDHLETGKIREEFINGH